MLTLRQARLWLAIFSLALALQGCWEEEEPQLVLLGNGGCRMADGGAGDPLYFNGLSEAHCKAKCFDGSGPCVAVEFNANNNMCEVHSDPIVKFERVEGVTCYVVMQ